LSLPSWASRGNAQQALKDALGRPQTQSSCPARAGHPVLCDSRASTETPRRTGSSAGACHLAGRRPDRVADDDERGRV